MRRSRKNGVRSDQLPWISSEIEHEIARRNRLFKPSTGRTQLTISGLRISNSVIITAIREESFLQIISTCKLKESILSISKPKRVALFTILSVFTPSAVTFGRL